MPDMPLRSRPVNAASCALGIDVGGTLTRWALVSDAGELLAHGETLAFSALQVADSAGRVAIDAALRSMAAAVAEAVAEVVSATGAGASGRGGLSPLALCAGITGCDASASAALQPLVAQVFSLAPGRIELASDIEMACRCAFAPGEGVLLYAGTGSIAGYVDEQGEFHRVGGRGVLIDDAGGGYWIAIEALRQVWRAEDLQPGAWRGNALARSLMAQIGGSDWDHTRRVVYGASRGEVGRLALAVAEAARAGDAPAIEILHSAGRELARLAQAMLVRHGERLLAIAGRAFELGPEVEAGLRSALPAEVQMLRITQPAEVAAAQRALARGTRA